MEVIDQAGNQEQLTLPPKRAKVMPDRHPVQALSEALETQDSTHGSPMTDQVYAIDAKRLHAIIIS